MKNNSNKKWCEVIAWLINCDKKHFFTDNSIFHDGKDIWNCSKNGELYGVINAINWTKELYDYMDYFDPIRIKIDKILKGQSLETNADSSTGAGLALITMLWKTTSEFEEFARKMLRKSLGIE